MYELFIEGFKVDIDQKISIALSYVIDDIAKFGSRETSFSKTIVLPGTGRNNQIFGYIYDLGSFNYESPGAANIGAFFNVAQTSRAELRLNGLLVLKGVFRITGIVKDKDIIEYEGALFGELSGFIAEIGTRKLEDLDFSAYNHTYTRNNIVNSWDTVNGSGYYYPLIDYGTYSTPQTNPGRTKIDYDYRTFRPALFVKEYIDKIFTNSGYTYQSNFLNTSFFKKLIIPSNYSKLTKTVTNLLDAQRTVDRVFVNTSGITQEFFLEYNQINLSNNFTDDGNPNFTYTGTQTEVSLNLQINGNIYFSNVGGGQRFVRIELLQNSNVLYTIQYTPSFLQNSSIININIDCRFLINNNDTIAVKFTFVNTIITPAPNNQSTKVTYSKITINSTNPVTADLILNDSVIVNNVIPRNITQKDFFTWIMKMFNLYITEDKEKEKHLIIEPYIDYYTTTAIDWTYKVDRSKPWQIKPMGQLNSRFFEYKFKDDNDFYNESYRKKYNQSYGDRLEDTKFQFAKDKQTVEIGFSPTILIQYQGINQQTKILPVIYKKSKGNAVDQEELTESNIRILQAKKITSGVSSWYITNNNATPANRNLGAALTAYGYAGHFDDPKNPTKDINFGAAQEIYFDPNTYTTNNLFNDYWSEYIAEIADKDSKILSCYVHLTPLDIAQLDFSKPILIDGIFFRLNKVEDFDYTNNELVKVELLKVINNG